MSFVDANKNVFGEVAFKDRLSEFASIFEARIEIFITKVSLLIALMQKNSSSCKELLLNLDRLHIWKYFTRENQMVPFERKEFVVISKRIQRNLSIYKKNEPSNNNKL